MPGPFCSAILADPRRRRDQGRAMRRRSSPAHAEEVRLEAWRSGVAARLGAGYEMLPAGNSGLVCYSISGFGRGGPWRVAVLAA